jgi:hypothetical protein
MGIVASTHLAPLALVVAEGRAKTKFLKYYLNQNSKIPLITSSILYNFIYSAYYGGITEVYAPFGLKLTYLDLNFFILQLF